MAGAGSSYADSDLAELRQRFDLLDADRRAYHETSQWAMRQNKDEIDALEARNKALREAVARLRLESGPLPAPATDAANDAVRLNQQLRELAKRHDELQNELRVRESLKKRCFDEVETVERELELVRKHREESDQAKELRSIESRLDTTNTKYNEALAVRRTYDSILQALQAERLSFDGRLVEFEKNVRQKQREAEELEEIGREAEKGKEVAAAELLELESKTAQERETRQHSLQSQRDSMHKGAEENQYLESQLIEQDEQDARMERERGRRDTEVREGSPDVALQIQFAQVEEGIRAFKEATGCTDIADVAGKFKTQWETVERLSEAMAGNEQTCETLKDELAKVTKVLQRAKFASAEPESGSRVGELEAQLQAARRQKEDLRKEYVAADTFLETVVDGVQYLYDRLHNSGKEESVETVVTRHNLSQKLAVCSEKLARIHEQVRTKEDLIESVLGGRSSVVVLPPIPGTKAAPEPLAIQQRDEGSDSEDTLFGDREAVKRRWEEIREAQKGSSESRGGGGFSLGKAIFSGPRMKE